jgi:hypothetical protein
MRNYWDTEIGEGEDSGTPPTCTSPDGKVGYGEPGGQCAACQFAQFGTGKNASQACSQRVALLIMMPDSGLPYMLGVPPSSIQNLRRHYLIPLSGKGRKYWQVATTIALEKDKNGQGIEYSKCVFKSAGPLDETTAALMTSHREAVLQVLAQAPATQSQSHPTVVAFDVDAHVTTG